MKRILITKATLDALRAAAIHPFKETATPAPGGMWSVPVADDTLERIEAARHEGESINDCVYHIVTMVGRFPS